MSQNDIINELDSIKPFRGIDKSKVRKSLYEMLKDETIRYTTAMKYKLRLRSFSSSS